METTIMENQMEKENGKRSGNWDYDGVYIGII